jgi:hypothetical protein
LVVGGGVPLQLHSPPGASGKKKESAKWPRAFAEGADLTGAGLA